MTSTAETIDLRGEARPRMAAFATLKEKGTDQPLELVFADEPSLLMQAVALMMRHRIHWEITDATAGAYRVRVVDRDTVAPETITELLSRDHERLDRLFAIALQHANRGEVEAVQALVEEFYVSQCRHLYAENDVLTPRFGLPRADDRNDATSAMLDEHDNILGELDQIRELLALGDTGMVAAMMAILSGTLAKHEGREESNLFPQWDAALRRHPDPELLPRVQAILEGAEDDQVPYWRAG